MSTFYTKKSVEDILVDVNLDKVSASIIFDENNDKFYYFDETDKDSIKFVKILKEIKIKKVLKKPESDDYIVSAKGDGGKFQLHISDKGFLFFDKNLQEYYKVVDKKDFDNLLNIIKSKVH